MKVNLAKSAGFCFGVKRAIDIAKKTALAGKQVYMMGDIVHNEKVARQIRKLGVRKVRRLSSGKDKVFLIRAHGTGEKIISKALTLGYKVIDATCPMVKEIHKIVKSAEYTGRSVIVIGDKKHDEIQGIIGQLKNEAIIIDPRENIPWHKIRKIKKASVVVQSTQNTEKILKIVQILRRHIRNLEFFNTICRPTRIKQDEIKKMPKDNDVMIIIGSRESANTKRLYEISKSLNEKSYWVQSKKDIRPKWFKGVNSLGITSGASTPDEATEETIAYIKKIS